MTGIEIYHDGKPIEELLKYNGPLIIDIPQLAYDICDCPNGLKRLIIYGRGIPSSPPEGCHKVKNLFVRDGKLEVEFDDGE